MLLFGTPIRYWKRIVKTQLIFRCELIVDCFMSLIYCVVSSFKNVFNGNTLGSLMVLSGIRGGLIGGLIGYLMYHLFKYGI